MKRRFLLVFIIITAMMLAFSSVALAQDDSDDTIIPIEIDVNGDYDDGDSGDADTGDSGDAGDADTGDSGDAGDADDGDSGDAGDADTGDSGDAGDADTGDSGDAGDADTGDSGDAGDDGDGGLEPVDAGDDGDGSVIDTGDDGDFDLYGYDNEASLIDPWTVEDVNLRKVVRKENMDTEDDTVVVHYYNANDQIIEKVVFVCPPKEVFEELIEKKILENTKNWPDGMYRFLTPSGEPIYETEISNGIEIDEVSDFDFEDEFLSYDEEDEDATVGIEMEEIVEEEGDLAISEISPEEEIEIEEFDESERTMLDPHFKSPLEIEIARYGDEETPYSFPYPEKYVHLVEPDFVEGEDRITDKYTYYTLEESEKEYILNRELANYEAGRVTIVVSQDVTIKVSDEKDEEGNNTGMFVAEFQSCNLSSYDEYHYIDGILISKFEVRKSQKRIIKYDENEEGKIISERIHHNRNGNTYDLYIFYKEGEVNKQELYLNGDMVYTIYQADPDKEYLFNVSLNYDMFGNLNSMDETVLYDFQEFINSGIVPVSFHLDDVDKTQRVKFAELGISKTYYDNWEMISQIEVYNFGGNRVGDGGVFGDDITYISGLAAVRYYGLNGRIIREERYDGNNLYSSIVFTYLGDGSIDRMSFVDVNNRVFKYKEGGAYYNHKGEEVSEEDFIKIRPAYDYSHLTEEYITEDGKKWIYGDDFYTNLEKHIAGFEEDEESFEVEDYDSGDDDMTSDEDDADEDDAEDEDDADTGFEIEDDGE